MNTRIDELKAPYRPRAASSKPSRGPRVRPVKKEGRNKNTLITIQQLKEQHIMANGSFFNPEKSVHAQDRVHGHPVIISGMIYFITSRRNMGRALEFSTWAVSEGDLGKVNHVSNHLTHGGAINALPQEKVVKAPVKATPVKKKAAPRKKKVAKERVELRLPE